MEDTQESWPVAATEPLLKHWLLTVRSDKVQMPDKHFAERTVVSHPGAVAVVTLDDASRVLMIRQYRHPVGYQLWEIPAGLRDAAGEPPLETARRELFEETGYRARDWHVLIDYFTSPGFTTERLRIYLARGVHPVGEDDAGAGYVRHDEEKYLVTSSGSRWPRRSAWRSRASSTTAPPSPASSPPSQPRQPTSATSAPPTPPNPNPPARPALPCLTLRRPARSPVSQPCPCLPPDPAVAPPAANADRSSSRRRPEPGPAMPRRLPSTAGGLGPANFLLPTRPT